ncbi:MAG: S24 family peptidase, partial [Microvirga sp.]
MPGEGPGRDAIEFPDLEQEKVFALAITGDALSPLYRAGDILIVSPTVSTRKGDRIVVCTTGGRILAQELKRRSATALTMMSLAKD